MSVLKLNTPVEIGRSKIEFSYNKPCLIIGSCFADNIGKRIADHGFNVMINPLGTTYNPASVFQTIERIANAQPFTEQEVTTIGAGDGRFCSFAHHTRNARPTATQFLEDANNNLQQANAFWQKTKTIIITLGTAWCFKNIASQQIVSNCLKHPAAEFSHFMLSSDECTSYLQKIITLSQNREIIFTVSPIRHLANGAHGNTLSKATLHLAIDKILHLYPTLTDYFPAFEILNDELRDYRFYADDMSHPSPLAEQYIYDRFIDFALPDNERPTLTKNIKAFKQKSHISVK